MSSFCPRVEGDSPFARGMLSFYFVRLLVDIDQTLYPLLLAMSTVPGGERIREEECQTWHSLQMMCDRPASEVILDAIQPEIATQIGLYPGASQALRDLAESNIDICLATHRDREYRDITERFLSEVGIGDFPLYIDEDLEKESLISDGLLIDDAPHILRDAHAAGLQVTTLPHLYNQEIAERLAIRRGKDWEELGTIAREVLLG